MAKLTFTAFTPAALKKYVEYNNLDLYSSKRLDIPVLRYYVFYNGKRKIPDETFLKLTDSMHGDNDADISSAEFTACMININTGHSTGIMERCPLLYQYSLFVADLRKNIDSGMFLGDAIDSTVENCIKKTYWQIFYGPTWRRSPICYSKNMTVRHISLLKKISAMKKAALLNRKTQNVKKKELTDFNLRSLTYNLKTLIYRISLMN